MIDLDSRLNTLDEDRMGKSLQQQAALQGGAALLELKAKVKHGDFLAMVENIGICPRKAQRWMAKARWRLDYLG